MALCRKKLPQRPLTVATCARICLCRLDHTSEKTDHHHVSNFRRSSGDFRAVETAPFLRACGLCKRRLGPGRDIYMYRGEVAFCSLECRQQLINQEEIKEKRALSTIKTDSHSAAVAAGSETSGGNNGETVAAA
ncbi:uncharacterized protein LOC109832505 [Asparagus officinalis]|uniref:uncharacterized protein LOC109832505 n=1 Tax=Asparagus officinalis TaxID=4686 RepID=UPI00098E5331|nr:uncharacterized protein LOC109832505 [Asparagus officinalis]